MNTKNITKSIFLASVMLALVFSVSSVQASTATTTKAQVKAQSTLAKIIARADKAIDARVSDLNKLNDRVQSMKNISDADKLNISSQVQTNISGLTSVRSKIDADTDPKTAIVDEKTITANYRIYALIIPQGYIIASVDRINDVVSTLSTLSSKLQVRITDLQTAGKDVTTLQNTLNDLNQKVADTKMQASSALSAVALLIPDQGNKSQLASNTSALKSARKIVKTATEDLQNARKDANTISKGLRALTPKNKTATTTVTTN